jgi:hypothetical protein
MFNPRYYKYPDYRVKQAEPPRHSVQMDIIMADQMISEYTLTGGACEVRFIPTLKEIEMVDKKLHGSIDGERAVCGRKVTPELNVTKICAPHEKPAYGVDCYKTYRPLTCKKCIDKIDFMNAEAAPSVSPEELRETADEMDRNIAEATKTYTAPIDKSVPMPEEEEEELPEEDNRRVKQSDLINLERASRLQVKSEWEDTFINDIKSRFWDYGFKMFISRAQRRKLREIAGRYCIVKGTV